MSGTTTDEDLLLPLLRDAVGAHGEVAVASVRVRPFQYETSHDIDEVEVVFEDGTQIGLLRKRLGRRALNPAARAVKPAFLDDPLREIALYRTVLPHLEGPARCHALRTDARRDEFWLILEKVPGRELYQYADVAVWQRAARWLADAHLQLAASSWPALDRDRLVTFDRAYYVRWLTRAIRFTKRSDRERCRILERMAMRFEETWRAVAASPLGLVHGEFYASNVLVSGAGESRVSAVDWEMAGHGPWLLDLGALVTGWKDPDRQAIVSAYLDVIAPHVEHTRERLEESLTCCQALQSLQWLGWSRHWEAPSEHRRDWLADLAAFHAR